MFNVHTSESRLVPATGAFTSPCVESTFHTHFSEKTQSLLVPIFGPTDCESSRILALGAGLRWPKGQQEWLSTWGFFLRESTTFRAPKVLDAFQNIRMAEKVQSLKLIKGGAHAPGRTTSVYLYFQHQNQCCTIAVCMRAPLAWRKLVLTSAIAHCFFSYNFLEIQIVVLLNGVIMATFDILL